MAIMTGGGTGPGCHPLSLHPLLPMAMGGTGPAAPASPMGTDRGTWGQTAMTRGCPPQPGSAGISAGLGAGAGLTQGHGGGDTGVDMVGGGFSPPLTPKLKAPPTRPPFPIEDAEEGDGGGHILPPPHSPPSQCRIFPGCVIPLHGLLWAVPELGRSLRGRIRTHRPVCVSMGGSRVRTHTLHPQTPPPPCPQGQGRMWPCPCIPPGSRPDP